MKIEEIRANAPSGATYCNDEFEGNGDVIYLRKYKGDLQYFDYKNEWSDILFNMPYKPL